MAKKKSKKIYIGGWFQRTILHLREIFNFLKTGQSPLKKLDSKKLQSFLEELKVDQVEMVINNFTYLRFSTEAGINVKIFEDGLIVLNKELGENPDDDMKALAAYYEYLLCPTLNYVFSLGMPLPKKLIGAKIVSPFFVVLNKSKEDETLKFLQKFKEEEKLNIKSKKFQISRGDKLYVINNISEKNVNIEKFIEEQIFIREFISQMHRYLNLHRIVWEKIDDLKEQGTIKGREVQELKKQLEGYSKKVDLIEARIGQMKISVKKRMDLARKNKDFQDLKKVLEFKYDALDNTLDYIKEIWGTTKDYVNSTNVILKKIRSQSTEQSIKSLSILTSMSVFASLIKISSQGSPQLNSFGLVYLVMLIFVGYIANKVMIAINMNKSYKIKNIKIPKDD
jgi:hypothetical protein